MRRFFRPAEHSLSPHESADREKLLNCKSMPAVQRRHINGFALDPGADPAFAAAAPVQSVTGSFHA